jgi:hypothetical protein
MINSSLLPQDFGTCIYKLYNGEDRGKINI